MLDQKELKFLFIVAVLLLSFLFLAAISGCAANPDAVPITDPSRYMSRAVFLSDPNINDPLRNNFFQKEKLKDAMNEVATANGLGANYFTFTQVPEAELEPITTASSTSLQTRSFVLIWPDSVFNAYAATKYNSAIPDINAITIVNEINKKQFYMIFRASCLELSSNCSNISTTGFKAMVARQLGLLVGLNFSCTNPQDTMCNNPSDLQWNDVNKFNYSRNFLNQLNAIDANPRFY